MGTRLIHKDQKGFTILELMVGIAISGLIAAAVTMAISQTFTGSTRNSNHMAAVRQVQEAGYWVSYYTYAAKNLTITGDSGFPIILRWIDFDTNQNHKVVFSLNSSGLRGSYYVNEVLNSTKTGKIPVFNFISSNKTKTYCQVSGGSAFSLPDINDAFKITGGNTSDNGQITVASGSISTPTTTGGATCVWDTHGYYIWTTTNTTGSTITVTAGGSGAKGSWTSETRAATAAITVDSDQDATLSSARGLIFTVTATVGSGQLVESETRVYKVIPKPVS